MFCSCSVVSIFFFNSFCKTLPIYFLLHLWHKLPTFFLWLCPCFRFSLFSVDINNFSKGTKWLFSERWFAFYSKANHLLLSHLSPWIIFLIKDFLLFLKHDRSIKWMIWPRDHRRESQNTQKRWRNVVFAYILSLFPYKQT